MHTRTLGLVNGSMAETERSIATQSTLNEHERSVVPKQVLLVKEQPESCALKTPDRRCSLLMSDSFVLPLLVQSMGPFSL